MKQFFVTGSTGYIGSQLCLALANRGNKVVAMYRDTNKTAPLKHPNIKLVKGDLFKTEVLETAMSNCDGLFHTAACARLWMKDQSAFYETNVKGTNNVIKAALKSGIKRAVFTSTAGVFGPSNGMPVNENHNRNIPPFNEYERTKEIADKFIAEVPSNELETVIVYPTRVFGPGLLSESNGVTRMIKQYLEGSWHTIPGNGKSIGNYVYIDDVVQGHILAYENGTPGGKYLLGGSDINYLEFFTILKKLSQKNSYLINIPPFIIWLIAKSFTVVADITKKPPLLTPDLAKKFLYNWETDCNKAIEELNYRPLTFQEGMQRTIDWLKSSPFL